MVWIASRCVEILFRRFGCRHNIFMVKTAFKYNSIIRSSAQFNTRADRLPELQEKSK